ncbi:MAG: glycosyltransferase [Proteobacteria bacterium]|nr:glycosyltransferase [Pseudomonadota bacterium]
MNRPLLVVFATFDPRGVKIGGIETHVRHMMRHRPEGLDFLLVGLDETGDLTPGVAIDLDFDGRPIRFMPLAHIPAEVSAVSARSLAGSTTLRFVLAGLRHIGALRREVRGRRASADLPRLEFAVLPRLMGVPYVLTVHTEIAVPEKTDSLLRHYRRLRALSEKFGLLAARHVFAVSEAVHGPLLAAYPQLKGRTSVLPVPVDTEMFSPTPFPQGEVFNIIYAGRFGAQKDPPLMFRTLAALKQRLPGQLRFHVLSSENPAQFPEFAAITDIATLHGPQNSAGVARLMREVHCGILSSQMEGTPCFLLETLASGRAFGSVELPSLKPFVLSGVSGELVPRPADPAAAPEAIAAGLETIWQAIRAQAYDPARIASLVEPFAAKRLYRTIFDAHTAALNKA